MRGSPFLRFILLAIALAATAMGLQRLTSARVDAVPVPVPEKGSAKSLSAPFRLVLSAPAAEVALETMGAVRLLVDASSLSGTVLIDPANPHVGIVVRWKNPPAEHEHRFAKLTLEVPGQETFTHVFDADGDIDDFVELPVPEKK